jgi:hypothetical protein
MFEKRFYLSLAGKMLVMLFKKRCMFSHLQQTSINKVLSSSQIGWRRYLIKKTQSAGNNLVSTIAIA